jgi:hypothetical protein
MSSSICAADAAFLLFDYTMDSAGAKHFAEKMSLHEVQRKYNDSA